MPVSISSPRRLRALKAAARTAEAQAGLFVDSSPILESVRRELTDILAILK